MKKILLTTALALLIAVPAYAGNSTVNPRSVSVEGSDTDWEIVNYPEGQYVQVKIDGLPEAMRMSVVRFREIDDRCANVGEYLQKLDKRARITFLNPVWDNTGIGNANIVVTGEVETMEGEVVNIIRLSEALC